VPLRGTQALIAEMLAPGGNAKESLLILETEHVPELTYPEIIRTEIHYSLVAGTVNPAQTLDLRLNSILKPIN